MASGSLRRDVSARVLARAGQEKPGCKRLKIADTELVEVHGDGKPAVERWTVERCDERVPFLVTFPRQGSRASFQISPE